ncbi:MAG: hypothetical protein NTV39_02165 [Candidatus Saccharibacteria bacterium]|nr:hypothetical protein [Candidatus Saccharibacteria bacterium]
MSVSLQKNRKKNRILPTIIFCLILVIATIFLLAYRQRIVDQITIWGYKPTTEATNLVKRAGMNDNGIFYYYASQPSTYSSDSAASFNKVCNDSETTTAILGCYSGNRIYIYVVADKQLDGISEVTAAHETLHAIYTRLNDKEKKRVDSLLESEYKVLSADKYYSDLLAFYSSYEPGQRDNELHSIIGTEVAKMNPELEAYYDQYFSNRQEVVNLDSQYSGVFKSLKAKADDLSVQIDKLLATITSLTSQYNTDAQRLKEDISSFNNRAQSGGFTSQSQFNNERAVLTGRASDLDAIRATIQSDYKDYQALVAQYNSYATQSKKLYDTINSTLVSSPSV